MGLAGARNSAVTGLQAQSTNISISADNIANAATPGYKAIKGQFSTLVTSGGSSGGYSSGGVSVQAQTLVESQGLIESTGRVTDLAVSGTGFFAVQDDSSNLLLSRAGSFTINNLGELENAAGYALLGWPLDDNGLRPGEPGNPNTTAAESTNSLVAVDTNAASGAANATTNVAVGMNLNAGQGIFQGATVTINPNSSANNAIAQDEIIVPAAGMEEGEAFTFTSNSVSSTFTYGGFAKSADLANGAIFGASSTATTFSSGATLTSGDRFTITTLASGTVTFTFQQSAPDTTAGQFNSLESLARAIDAVTGLTARVSGSTLYVSSADANEAITFGDVSSSNLHNELGFGNEPAAATGVDRWNTITGLATLVNATSQLGAVVNNPSSGAEVEIFAADPQLTLVATKLHGQQNIDLSSAENSAITETDVIVPIGDMTVNTSTLTLTVGATTDTFTYGGVAATQAVTSGIFGATTASGGSVVDTTDRFTVASGLTNGEAWTFSDENGGTVIATFTDVATSALAAGQFNSLLTLASVINADGDFSARVVNDRLYVSATNSAFSVVVNSDTTADAVIAAGLGGDWAVDGGDVRGGAVAAAGRFSTLAGLAALINDATNDTAITATVTTGTNATIALVQDAGTSITVGGASNTDLLVELGLAAGDVGDGFFTEMGIDGVVAAAASTATVAVTYDPSDDTKNMAGGAITAHFPRNLQIFDSLGTAHDFNLSFLKVGSNEWAVEFYAVNPSEVSGGGDDGLIVSGTLNFNGDGTLQSISSALAADINIAWTTGASASTISFDLGTAGSIAGTPGATVIGLTDGVRQFDASYNVEFIEQNGVAAGQFNGVTVSEDGVVSANFSNGEIRAIYQLPIVVVANQNALQALTGNVFAATQGSGDVNLKVAGAGGAGVIVPEALEGSTADIAEELTKTIGIQSNYNANATLISTVRDMEEELNRRL